MGGSHAQTTMLVTMPQPATVASFALAVHSMLLHCDEVLGQHGL
jgi:hypothetical protein